MEGHRMSDKNWRWFSDVVYMGGGAKLDKPRSGGTLCLSDAGLEVDPEDDFYGGTIPKAEAIDLARAILARFGET
jgi:hypothetical protein